MSIKGSFIRFIIVDIPLVVVLLFAFHTWDQKTLTIQSPFDERIQEANAYLKNGDFNTGADLLEKALIADPSQNSLHLRLGVLYDDYLLEKNKAAYHYQLYLNAVPDTQLQNKIKEWIGNAKKDIQEPVEITLKNPSVKEPLAVSAQDIQDMQHKYEQLKIHTDKLEKLLFDQEKQLESMDVLKQQLVLSKEDYKKILQEFSLEKKR
ncbi:MAG: hypothetical protein Q8Q33_03665, partial [Chlamydiota bacterium]|nr:hypothetical protein [Chlamydiota bacterium]